MKRLGIILFILSFFLSPALYSLEEQRFQAKILVEEREEPSLIFPLSRPDFEEVKKLFLPSSSLTDYILYETSLPGEADARDLCGFQEPPASLPEGEIL